MNQTLKTILIIIGVLFLMFIIYLIVVSFFVIKAAETDYKGNALMSSLNKTTQENQSPVFTPFPMGAMTGYIDEKGNIYDSNYIKIN